MDTTILDLSSVDTFIIDFMMDVLTDDDFISVVIDTLKIIIPMIGLITPGLVIFMMTLNVWVVSNVLVGVFFFSFTFNNDVIEEEKTLTSVI